MNYLFQYLLQSSACLAALYLVYWVFLRRETFFFMNRFYLITASLLSLVIPLFRINLHSIAPSGEIIVYLDTVIITPQRIEYVASHYGTGFITLGVIYLTGVIVLSARLVFQIIQLILLARSHEIRKKEGLNFVMVNEDYSPFSFFNYIFINNHELEDKGISTIINHEKIHVKQLHSTDLIIMELLIIVQWFNPFAWFTNRSIKAIHEFLADDGVVQNGQSKMDYQEILLTRAAGIRVNNLANNFNFSLLKKRIIMMTKTKSPLWARCKIIIAMPVFLMVLFIFSATSFEGVIAQTAQVSTVQKTAEPAKDLSEKKEQPKQQLYFVPVPDEIKKADAEQNQDDPDKVYTVVENLPSFPGGQEELFKFLRQNIVYPEDAMNKGLEGKVFVTFVVKADGTVNDVKILKGAGHGFDEEAYRVVKSMPKWNPGTQKGKPVNVAFNLPISFKLEKKKGEQDKLKQQELDQQKKEQYLKQQEQEQKKNK